MLSLSEILLLTIIYCIAYGFGVFLSKLWWWLRIVIFIIICRTFAYQFNDFETVNLPVFLVVIVPMGIMAIPSLKQLSFQRKGFSFSPFRFIHDKISMRRYTKWQEQEALREQEQARREELERLERIMRMQAEEAERQRQFEREQAEQEARNRAKEGSKRRVDEESQSKAGRGGQEQSPQRPKAGTKKDPYEVLRVDRNASLEEIRKAYTELSKKYHPDRVSHLGIEFQEMAHEKYIEIKAAWEKIQTDRKSAT